MTNGKRWFAGGYYGMASDMAAGMTGRNDALSSDTRLVMLTMERVNIWGHAGFDPGELEKLMGGRGRFRSGREKLIRAEVIAPESTSLCIVLSAILYRRGDKSYDCCAEPTHRTKQRLMWMGAPYAKWEHHEGGLDESLGLTDDPSTSAEQFARDVETYLSAGG